MVLQAPSARCKVEDPCTDRQADGDRNHAALGAEGAAGDGEAEEIAHDDVPGQVRPDGRPEIACQQVAAAIEQAADHGQEEPLPQVAGDVYQAKEQGADPQGQPAPQPLLQNSEQPAPHDRLLEEGHPDEEGEVDADAGPEVGAGQAQGAGQAGQAQARLREPSPLDQHDQQDQADHRGGEVGGGSVEVAVKEAAQPGLGHQQKQGEAREQHEEDQSGEREDEDPSALGHRSSLQSGRFHRSFG